jgi:hypothetical protein
LKKNIFAMLSLIIILLLGGCTSTINPTLKGSYQTEKDVNGYFIEISIQQQESSFVEYIDNREIDRGTYEKNENNVYKIKSDKQNFQVTLSAKNSFEIIIKKLNTGKPIQLKNVSVTPTYFSTIFDDVDKYKSLLD